ncbi:MAG: hypothetical protein AAGG68_17160 [Bacteroidota bacterium]
MTKAPFDPKIGANDAIILESANQTGIKQIITANTKDFTRLISAFEYEIDVIGT